MNLGFTLIELAIALVILSLLGLGLAGTIGSAFEQEGRRRNQMQLDEIREALLGFAVEHGRLPCPDCANGNGTCAPVASSFLKDGAEDLIGTVSHQECATLLGELPAATLGLPRHDAWGGDIRYALSSTYAKQNPPLVLSGPCTVPVDSWFGICTPGELIVTNKPLPPEAKAHPCPPSAPPTGVPAVKIKDVVAVVISEGKKAHKLQPISCYEKQNADSQSDSVFVASDYRTHQDPSNPEDETANYYFDDMLIWISSNVLRNRMITAGKLP